MNIFDSLASASTEPAASVCSRKGCKESATTALLWNNPKIHTPERRKTWLACDEHAAWLEDYLKSRSLWKQTLPFDAAKPHTGSENQGTNSSNENL